jgi:hypothetical protein|tara:strand:- start:203 stop:529 length:327 start_codon:yes stop_codon:yes gene_type:complete
MKFIKHFFFLTLLSITLNNCSGLKEAGEVLRNEKSSSTDEFLIKKKEPLTKPPDFDVIPEPGSIANNRAADKKKNNIKKILKASQAESSGSKSKSSSTEDSILKQIKK